MDGNLEFRLLLGYLGAMYLFPVIRWRKTRRTPVVVGIRGPRQDGGRLLATAFFVAPLANYLLDGPWPWYPELGVPPALRWAAAVPATLAVLLLIWACRYTESGPETEGEPFLDVGPYRYLRHPQLLASSIFLLAMAVLANNGVVLLATIVVVLVLRLVVAPAVEADLAKQAGKAYQEYRQRTGSFFIRLRRVPQAQYMVPRRFGLSAVIGLTTIFAFLFGVLNFWRASPPVYLFVATEISAICLVQILFGSFVRRGSAITGAVLLPFWTAVSIELQQLNAMSYAEIAGCLVGVVLLGALVGYCIGGLAAGFFLVMDMVEPYLPGGKRERLKTLAAKPDQNAN